MHYGVGFIGAALSAVVAANTENAFLTKEWSVGLAAAAAGTTFLITALGASAKSAAFEAAAREIEKGVSLFRSDESNKGTPTKSILYDAEARGIDILNTVK